MNTSRERRERRGDWWRRFYTGITDYTLTMCLFYAYYVWMYIFMGWVSDAGVQTVDIVLANQFLVPSILTGIAQYLIIPPDQVTVRRSVIWSVVSILSGYVPAVLFGWFGSFPLWAELVFWFAIVAGLLFMLLYFYYRLQSETRELNEQLKRFQQGDEPI